MRAPPHWRTLREIDAALALPKGSAFRALKRLVPPPAGPDELRQLRHGDDDAGIAALRAAGRLYASSVHALLVSPETEARIVAALRGA